MEKILFSIAASICKRDKVQIHEMVESTENYKILKIFVDKRKYVG